MEQVDVAVIGLGIMGSAAAWQLAAAGARVLGIEAGSPAHAHGSSHGASRIFRRAYWEGSGYLPLLDAAHAGWMQLQSETDSRLLYPCGGIFIGSRTMDVVSGSLRTAVAAGLPHASWDAAQIRRHLPQFRLAGRMHAIHEPGAYAIAAERARFCMLDGAVRDGARLMLGEQACALDSSGDSIAIVLRSGARIHADAVVVTTGPWIAGKLLPELSAWLTPCRIPVFWFQPRPGQEAGFAHQRFPVFLHHFDDGALLYGLPAGIDGDAGVKIGFHNRQKLAADPAAACAFAVPPALGQEIADRVTQILPGLMPSPSHGKWCWYTMSADESFLIGRSAAHPRAVYASACSGHGFKFAPAIGQVLAALALRQTPALDISAYHPGRFS